MPRIIMGTNWLLGYSHTGRRRRQGAYSKKYQKPEDFYPVISAYLDYGIDAIMGPVSTNQLALDAIKLRAGEIGSEADYCRHTGYECQRQCRGARRSQSRDKAQRGYRLDPSASFTTRARSSSVNKNLQNMTRPARLPRNDTRTSDFCPGLSAHMPELVTYSDANGYDVETYIQIFNCMNFLMQVEV